MLFFSATLDRFICSKNLKDKDSSGHGLLGNCIANEVSRDTALPHFFPRAFALAFFRFIIGCRPMRAQRQEDVVVNALKRRRLVAWLGIWMMNLPGPLLAQSIAIPSPPIAPQPEPAAVAPNPLPVQATEQVRQSANQKLADVIADQLRQRRQLQKYQVDIAVQGGVVELKGQVADQQQHDEVLRIVHHVPGVEQVRDSLAIRNVADIRPAQLIDGPPVLQPGPLPKPVGDPPAKDALPQEPTPIFQPGPPGAPNPTYQPPRMPPYAWPTYAPYNNLSRVAYPNLYPYYSWPFIGPFYPFPKVPPGWRSIELTWQDGKWWYGKKARSYDWWRIRYW